MLRKARREVYNLGMSGFGKEKKEESRIALAVKLGAKVWLTINIASNLHYHSYDIQKH